MSCTKPSNRLVIFFDDLEIQWIHEAIQDFIVKHEITNVEAIQILENAQEIRKLRRTKPHRTCIKRVSATTK